MAYPNWRPSKFETLIKLTKKYLEQPIKVNSTIVSKYI